PGAVEGARIGGRPRAVEHASPVELVVQDLEDAARPRVAFVELPEAGGHAAVLAVVTVMEGPDTMAGGLEDRALEDAEAETEEHVRGGGAYALRVGVAEPIDETRPRRPHRDAVGSLD